MLAIYALSQQIPALFTPEPLLASVLALLRTLLLFGLLGLGALLSDSRHLRFLIPGLIVVYLTAIGFAVLAHTDLTAVRMNHPYLTSIALGLSGVFGIWLSLFLHGRLIWRIPLGLGGLGILMLSGSRGPLLAAIIGSLIGALVRTSKRLGIGLVCGSILIAGAFYTGQKIDLPAITRLDSQDVTGRDIIWSNTLSTIAAYPLTGVGSYRLGAYITPPNKVCEFFSDADGTPITCPVWFAKIDNPWTVAHNLILQQLSETGPLGLLGMIVLLYFIICGTLLQKDPLSTAIIFGILATNILDNTILVPNPFFAEIFWLIAGAQMSKLRDGITYINFLPYFCLFFLFLPFLLPESASVNKKYQIYLNVNPKNVDTTKKYVAYFLLEAPPGSYRLEMKTCLKTCSTLLVYPISIKTLRSPLIKLEADIHNVPTQTLQIALLRGISSLSPAPLSTYKWQVEIQP